MKNIGNLLEKGIIYIYFFIITIILSLLIVVQPNMEYNRKIVFDIPNAVIAVTSIFIIGLILFLATRIERFKQSKTNDRILVMIIIATLALQIYVSYCTYFITDWDVSTLMSNAYKIVDESNNYIYGNRYFSRYPNNLFLEFIFVNIIRAFKIVGIKSYENITFGIIVIQCIINSLTGFITFKVCHKITKSYFMSWLSFVLYFILIGTSMWITIPYSDSIILFAPVLILYLYNKISEGRNNYVLLFLISLIGFVGFKIKPQVIIVIIAIVIIEFIKCITYKKTQKNLLVLMSALIIVFISGIPIVNIATNSLGFTIDTSKELGLSHFLMMGANDRTDGCYSSEDVTYSSVYINKKDRKKANINKFISRVNDRSIEEKFNFLAKKTFVNYGDGTFAYGMEGLFIKEKVNKTNTLVSKVLQQCVWPKNYGEYYHIFKTIKHFVWILVLMMSLFSIFGRKSSKGTKEILLILTLSILGLTLFETLFEARARYLYIYAPFYILLGVIGIENFKDKLFDRVEKDEE